MRPEGDDHTLVTPVLRSFDKPLKHKTVPEMDTVKKACGYNHFTSSKSCLCGISGFLAYILAATWYIPVLSGTIWV